MAPLRRLKVAAFLLLAVVIVISVAHMVIGLGIEIVALVFSPWFVVPGFIVAWLLAPWLFGRQANR